MIKTITLFTLLSLNAFAQNDYQWGLKNTGKTFFRFISDINSIPITGEKGFDINYDPNLIYPKKEVVIALIDTGVDETHPDLQNVLISPGFNFVRNNTNTTDTEGHGTHLAGIIAANTNKFGIHGINSKLRILPLKVFDNSKIAELEKSSYPQRVNQAIQYAISKNVDVISLSLGWPRIYNNENLEATIELARQKGIIIVAAAGNDSADHLIYPCAFESVICVGSVSANGEISDFSNFGQHVDIFAPGENILSTIPRMFRSKQFGVSGYDFKDGTSQAAPFVAATIATLKGNNPDLAREDLIARLLGNASTHSFGKMLDFKSTLTREADVVRAEIKTKNKILIDENGFFEYRFNVFTKKPVDIEVKLLNNYFKTKLEASGEVVFKGRIDNLNLESTQTLTIKLNNDLITKKVEVLNIFSSLKNVVAKKFMGNNKMNRDEVEKAYLFGEPYLSSNQNYEIDLKNNKVILRVVEESETEIYPVIKLSYEMSNHSLIGSRMLDVNGDNQLDFVVLTRKGDDIFYNFFNNKLEPLFKSHQWKYSPKISSASFDEVFFLTHATNEFGIIMIPSFVSDIQGRKILFHLEPKVIDNEVLLETTLNKEAIFDHYSYDEDSQTLFTFRINNHNEVKLTQFMGVYGSVTQSLPMRLPVSRIYTNISDSKLTLAYPDQAGNLQYYFFNINRWGYASLDYSKLFKRKLIDPIESLIEGLSDTAIFVTSKTLVMANKETFASVNFPRSSFLPAEYTKYFARPFEIGEKKMIQVDSSALTTGMLKIYSEHDGDLISHVSHAFEVPDTCSVLAPSKEGKIRLMCYEGNEAVLKLLSLE